MRKKFTQVMMLSLLLTGAATVFGGYAYAGDDDDDTETTVEVKYRPYKPTINSTSVGEQAADGTATVTFNITTPDQSYDTYDGALDKEKYPLTEITSIVIAEEGVDEEFGFYTTYNTLKTVTEGIEIGAEMTIELENQAEGKHTYYVFALNSKSPSSLSSSSRSSAASVNVTVGKVYEAPAKVTDLTYVDNYPEISLSWTAPTEGKDGGSIKVEELTYDVYRNSDVIASGLTETTYKDELSLTEPTEIKYSVVAKTSKGSSDKVTTASFIEGPAYSIPFTETFKEYGYSDNLWSVTKSETSELNTSIYLSNTATGVNDTSLSSGYDGDQGALVIKQNGKYFGYFDSSEEEKEGTVLYTSAPISLKEAKRPVLSFYQYIAPSEKNVLKASVSIEQNGEKTVLNEYTYTNTDETEGWRLESYDLSDFVGGDIKLVFSGTSLNSAYGFTAFDVINIEEALDYDVVLNSFTAPSNINAGDEYTATVDLYNKGVKAAEKFDVLLYLNDTLLKSQSIASLAAGASTTVTFTATADNSYGSPVTFDAKVNFEADEDQSNNTASATAKVKIAAAPAVTNLKAEAVNSDIQLTWSAPDYILPATVKVTESFEDYDNAAKSFGSWTMSTAHYYTSFTSYGIDDEVFSGKATFTVVDSEELEAGEKWVGKAATGTHYLMNTGNSYSFYGRTDYLISPALSGNAQTVTFKIASLIKVTDYWSGDDLPDHVKVLYSTTTNDKSAFTETLVDKDIESVLKSGDDFEIITAELPEGAKYFAIVITNPDDEDGDSIVLLDDITFEQGQDGIQAQLIGYDVYEDNTKLNSEVLTETSYTVVAPEKGTHKYTVVVRYNVGSSDASNEASVELSGVEALEGAGVSVYASAGEIHISAAKAQVYDLAGRLVAVTTGDAVVAVAHGTYVVRADNQVVKVLVK
jgi:hypothetical protein